MNVSVTAYFTLEYLIWNTKWSKDPYEDSNDIDGVEDEELLISAFWNNKALYFNTVNLSFCWFIVCLNFYGFLNSWCKVSFSHTTLENEALSATFGKNDLT